MAVDINLTPIGSGFNRTVINDNFNSIEVALTEVLGRNGVTPNQMNSDIDMDGNDLLNVGDIDVQSLTIDGETFLPDSVIAQGPPGEDASITVGTVTTGAAGTDVIITNVGTAQDAVFDFTIPRGDTGASGAGTGDMLAAQNLNDVASKPTAFANIKQDATETATGVVELATDAEVITGTDTTRAVTPAGVAAVLATLSGQTDVQTFTASGTWTKPAFGTFAYIEIWGAGGSGGKAGTDSGGGGGGGGAYNSLFIPLASLTSTVAVTIGAGGAARTSSGSNGIAGGNSSFGAFLLACGGGGGGGIADSNTGGGGGGQGSAGATATGVGGLSTIGASDFIYGGGTGNAGPTPAGDGVGSHFGGGGGGGGSGTNTNTAGTGGYSTYGGGGGGGGEDAGTGGAAGISKYGGNGGAGSTGSATAGSGVAPGGGGGGSESGTSGAGARGECRIYVW